MCANVRHQLLTCRPQRPNKTSFLVFANDRGNTISPDMHKSKQICNDTLIHTHSIRRYSCIGRELQISLQNEIYHPTIFWPIFKRDIYIWHLHTNTTENQYTIYIYIYMLTRVYTCKFIHTYVCLIFTPAQLADSVCGQTHVGISLIRAIATESLHTSTY